MPQQPKKRKTLHPYPDPSQPELHKAVRPCRDSSHAAAAEEA
jgi:hypothetical protein